MTEKRMIEVLAKAITGMSTLVEILTAHMRAGEAITDYLLAQKKPASSTPGENGATLH